MQQADKNNLQKLGLVIKNARLNKCKSLNKFAMQKGFITPATLSRIENGIADLKLSTLIRISYMLGVRPSELLKNVDFDYNFEDE